MKKLLLIPALTVSAAYAYAQSSLPIKTVKNTISAKPIAAATSPLLQSSPQFFSVVYTISAGDEVFEYNISHIKKGVDFNILKNMLGK
jgi:hypothetical protein